jgi:hypothetical protein
MVVFLLLLGGLAYLVSRLRSNARAVDEAAAVLTGEDVTARELRARAEAALAEGRHEDAVTDGFRALALRQVELGRLDDAPGATAHEVSLAVAAAHPDRRTEVTAAGLLFDVVRYGDRSATREQGASVLALDDELAGVRR